MIYLIIVLVAILPVQHSIYFEDVAVGICTLELVTRAIEAKNDPSSPLESAHRSSGLRACRAIDI